MQTSTGDQTGLLQREALENAGCKHIVHDAGISGSAVSRPQFKAALAAASEGDELVIWRLDRLGRSLHFILDDFQRIEIAGRHVRLINEQIDTTTPGGRLYFHMTSAFAEFERERTKAGMAPAKRAGRKAGRPATISDEMWKDMQPRLIEPGANISRIARSYGVLRHAIIRRGNAKFEL